MPQQELRYEKPAVRVVYARDHVGEEVFAQLLMGIEEEGIPYDAVPESTGETAVVIAHNASIASRFGVGVGVAQDGIVLHYHQLGEQSPLYKIPLKSSQEAMRALGANAARLVKGQPFKDLK